MENVCTWGGDMNTVPERGDELTAFTWGESPMELRERLRGTGTGAVRSYTS